MLGHKEVFRESNLQLFINPMPTTKKTDSTKESAEERSDSGSSKKNVLQFILFSDDSLSDYFTV